MRMEAELSQWISRHIEAFVRDETQPEYLKLHVSRNSVLPILISWTGFWGLRADGEILVVDTEEGRPAVVERDERERRIALFQGAKTYPELTCLVPERPEEARDCPTCSGTGRLDVTGVEPDTIICSCGGLGWVG